MRLQIETYLKMLRAKVDKYMQKRQAQYKSNYNRRVRKIPSFIVVQYAFFDKPPAAETSRGRLGKASVQ